jgi:hypothetical protein
MRNTRKINMSTPAGDSKRIPRVRSARTKNKTNPRRSNKVKDDSLLH